ncbi:MAG: SLC13 family permease [bacterium]
MSLGVAIILFLLILLVILFVMEPIRIDLIALSIPVFLVLLEPWTQISSEEAVSGFSSPATITIGSMFVISYGVERSGVVQIIGDKIYDLTGKDEIKQLGLIVVIAGLIAGVINNTPVVALFIPMVIGIAARSKNSPSKFLIPLSFAAMMGGMLTLIGTSTNILASDILARRLGEGFSMFEFTHLGFVVLVTGTVYLLVLGRKLLPARIKPELELTEEFGMGQYLTEVVITEYSPLVGDSVREALKKIDCDLDIVQLIRRGEKFFEPLENKIIQQEDHLIVRTDQKNLIKLIQSQNLEIIPKTKITQNQLEDKEEDSQNLVELVIPHGSFLEGQTLKEVNFLERYNSSILAIRQGEELAHKRMENITLKAGDVLLLTAGEKTVERLRKNRNFIVSSELGSENYRSSKIIYSLIILTSVILLATFNILPIVIASLAGVIAMVISGCLKPGELPEAINWDVIFLLSGLIPLGLAMENTGTAEFVATQILKLEGFLPPLFILGLFYIITGIFANLIGNNTSVILMLPIALDAAEQLGLNPIAFALVVTFAASSAFLTPMSYQTNLMVYGPGGYKFQDFFVVGAPLQLILTIIVPLFIYLFWGL